VRGDRPGGLFLAITRHQRIVGTGLTSHAVYNILHKRRREAGVARLSPHDFRRTFVGDLLDAGVDLRTDRARAVLLAPGGSYRCTLEFAPDTPDGWFVPPMYQTGTPRRAA
jgi:integrase